MTMFTRQELDELRRSCIASPAAVDAAAVERLIAQAEYALDCARLLEEAVRFPAEPYGEAEALVAQLTNGFNEIWNRHHYREAAGAPGASGGSGARDRPGRP